MHYITNRIIEDVKVPPMDERTINALNSLDSFKGTITGKKDIDFERALAVRMYIHILGDVHQPLHTCSRFNSDFPQGDRGGNNFIVNWQGKQSGLHFLYDDIFGVFGQKGKVQI